MQSNIHQTTGIRFGCISGNSIHPEILDDLYMQASAIACEEARTQFHKEYARDHDIDLDDSNIFDQLEYAGGEDFLEADEAFNESFQPDEPSACFEYQGVTVHYGYLGGAALLIIGESPVTTKADLCSPCVPNAGNLDSLNPDGYECYDIPADWYKDDENES